MAASRVAAYARLEAPLLGPGAGAGAGAGADAGAGVGADRKVPANTISSVGAASVQCKLSSAQLSTVAAVVPGGAVERRGWDGVGAASQAPGSVHSTPSCPLPHLAPQLRHRTPLAAGLSRPGTVVSQLSCTCTASLHGADDVWQVPVASSRSEQNSRQPPAAQLPHPMSS